MVVQLDEIAAMLEDAADGKWFNEFLQACVSANVRNVFWKS